MVGGDLITRSQVSEARPGAPGTRRYRVGDYRILCDIQDRVLTVLVLQIGNRREVYR